MGDTDAATVLFNARQAYELRFAILTTGTEKVFGFGENSVYNKHYSIWGAGDNGTTYSFYSSMGSLQQPIDWDDNSGGKTFQR